MKINTKQLRLIIKEELAGQKNNKKRILIEAMVGLTQAIEDFDVKTTGLLDLIDKDEADEDTLSDFREKLSTLMGSINATIKELPSNKKEK